MNAHKIADVEVGSFFLRRGFPAMWPALPMWTERLSRSALTTAENLWISYAKELSGLIPVKNYSERLPRKVLGRFGGIQYHMDEPLASRPPWHSISCTF